MKISKILYGFLALAGITLASCDNEYPKFDDSEAFVAFTTSTVSVGEADGKIEIPVLLTSLSGIETEVPFEIDTENSTAVEGTHFTIEGEKKFKFTKDAPTQKIVLNVIDNDTFDGNVKIVFKLGDSAVKFGACKSCTITIQDDEHPLKFILGTYSASADGYFSSRGHFDWDITIARDDEDLSKVWIQNLDPYFAANGFVAPEANNFYGIVNEDKTEIRIPVGQKIGYNDAELAGFTGADPDESEELNTGDNIVLTIKNGGASIVIENGFGIVDPDGWWNLMYGNLEITKK